MVINCDNFVRVVGGGYSKREMFIKKLVCGVLIDPHINNTIESWFNRDTSDTDHRQRHHYVFHRAQETALG